jgi:hypothetical protein
MRKAAKVETFLAAAVLAAALAPWAGAAEPPCQCPQAQTAGNEVCVPILTRLPYINRLFKVVRTGEPGSCSCQGERIGIDFDIATVSQAHCPLATGVGAAKCTAAGCTAAGCTAAGGAACKCCTASGCAGKNCPCTAAAVAAAVHEEAAADHHAAHAHHHEHIKLTAEKAALEAVLEAREQTQERFAEMLESLAGLTAENARLEAKLEARQEREKLLESLHALSAENKRLAGQIEAAERQAETIREAMQIALENERLKARVAQLEASAAETSVRTAKRQK